MRSLDLSPIGNCQVSALVDEQASIIWSCVPRVDGDPVFCALLDHDEAGEQQRGFWDFELIGLTKSTQHYVRNTPVLVTRLEDDRGGIIEITDFCPRFEHHGRTYRPVAIVRTVTPIAGSPRIRVRLRPARHWGAGRPEQSWGSNHIRYILGEMTLRLTTNAPVGQLRDERIMRVEKPLQFFLGPDEPFVGDLSRSLETMHEETIAHWQHWVRGLAIPLEWQDYVIRAAITLKLCQHEETGAIVAALTTSIPEARHSGRNWDYRYCWIRDAYYTVQALNRLGALDVLESYLNYLRNLIDNSPDGHIQPLYGVGGETNIDERIETHLAGYRGMEPVRVGNAAWEQIQHDAYGQIVLSSAQAFFDSRLLRMSDAEDFKSLERVGDRAWEMHNAADAGLWEFRTRTAVHTYSSVMSWAACDRLGNVARCLGLDDRAAFWGDRAAQIRTTIEKDAWSETLGRFTATFGGEELDASLLQLVDMRFIAPDDPRFRATFEAVEKGLRRGPTMLRYASEDDFGLPETAFNFCTFWLIEALHMAGRDVEARELFENILKRTTRCGLLSEDMDLETGELWGNFPQTYSLVGLINCAGLLSKPWSSVR